MSGLEAADGALRQQRLTRTDVDATIEALRHAVQRSYEVVFPAGVGAVASGRSSPWPTSRATAWRTPGSCGCVAADGRVTYCGDLHRVRRGARGSRRLDTEDFRTLPLRPAHRSRPQNKGMALFPRQVGGRYLALSRWDRENNAVAGSADGYHWEGGAELQAPTERWELIQLGNCGPPMETGPGWLVLTHGVGRCGPTRSAPLLLDLDEPTRVVGRLTEPLLQPDDDERDGYVPNVVYSCGGTDPRADPAAALRLQRHEHPVRRSSTCRPCSSGSSVTDRVAPKPRTEPPHPIRSTAPMTSSPFSHDLVPLPDGVVDRDRVAGIHVVERVDKPWGYEEIFAVLEGRYVGKMLHITRRCCAVAAEAPASRTRPWRVRTGRVVVEHGTDAADSSR